VPHSVARLGAVRAQARQAAQQRGLLLAHAAQAQAQRVTLRAQPLARRLREAAPVRSGRRVRLGKRRSVGLRLRLEGGQVRRPPSGLQLGPTRRTCSERPVS